MALIIVLIFLQIFTVLGLLELKQAAMNIRAQEHLWVRELALFNADQALTGVERTALQGVLECHIPVTPALELIQHTKDWWQTAACSGNFAEFRYYYVMESLGGQACYYRITLHAEPNINLQSTISLCGSLERHIKIGEQMRREW